ncbi:FliO/MopB family protein [Candidatus Blastococcus massiliensis]|uniref:FliO/MopB family protein n=1 Tax=Candidatus Blastococcus massiliensis TaxID=1470358 RepID=UPI0004BC847B|nr:flagellar biosynthetic protein FliO [Candidatus Blastococcus massiliensis]
MTWMVIRLILSLAFVAAVLLFAARLAKKRGLGRGNDLIEIVSRQRLGRTSTVNVVRIADVVLVVGATEEQVTLLAEVDAESVAHAMGEEPPVRRPAAAPQDEHEQYAAYDAYDEPHLSSGRSASPALAGSVLDRDGWGNLVHELRERTVRRS